MIFFLSSIAKNFAGKILERIEFFAGAFHVTKATNTHLLAVLCYPDAAAIRIWDTNDGKSVILADISLEQIISMNISADVIY